MIVVDTSVVLAFMNQRDSAHAEVGDWMEGIDEELVTTPLAMAEIDHLVRSRGGAGAATAFQRELLDGAYAVEWWSDALRETVEVAQQYADLGLTDASLVALAARLRTIRVATLDERHFRAVRPLTGEAAFSLLPADAR